MFACECGMENIANELLSSGANAGIKDLNGETGTNLLNVLLHYISDKNLQRAVKWKAETGKAKSPG